jgi:hypothetical protein
MGKWLKATVTPADQSQRQVCLFVFTCSRDRVQSSCTVLDCPPSDGSTIIAPVNGRRNGAQR